MNKDTVYAQPQARVEAFTFDGQVADVFENMINRSVPGYPLMLDMIGLLAEQYAQPNAHVLGCPQFIFVAVAKKLFQQQQAHDRHS